MVSGSYSGLLLSVLIILLALEYSTANGHHLGNIGKRGKDVSLYREAFDGTIDAKGRKPLVGRKMLQGLDEKPFGKNRPAILEKSFQEPETESDRSIKRNDESKAFFEAAAAEVANLMGKDYKGADRPRRKPPINNHEPED